MIISQKLDYLTEAIDRLNKFDWRAVAFSTIMTISATLSLDTEKGSLLIELFKQIFVKIRYLIQL